MNQVLKKQNKNRYRLEQLERLCSQIPPTTPWLPIGHTSDSHQIPKSKQDKVKDKSLKKLPKIQILQEILHATYLLKLLDKMYKYEMDPTRTVGAIERTRDAWRTS